MPHKDPEKRKEYRRKHYLLDGGKRSRYNIEYNRKNKEKVAARLKKYAEKNREIILLGRKLNYRANKQQFLKKARERELRLRRENPVKYKLQKKKHRDAHYKKYGYAAQIKWRKKNPLRAAAIWARYNKTAKAKIRSNVGCGKRRARIRKAMPKWLTKDHHELIKMHYQRAAYMTEVTGIQWDVDHIIPLANKLVCGLHVPWNLRVITRIENNLKRTRFFT